MKTRVQIPNEKAFEFEEFSNEFFPHMNPELEKEGDFRTTFVFDTVTAEEEARVNDFADTFETA